MDRFPAIIRKQIFQKMAKIDEFLLDRMRNILHDRHISWEEKRMFGGIAFMVDDKMCFGTFRGGMMTRVEPEEMVELKKREGVEQMTMKDRPMKNYLYINPIAYDREEDLEFWIQKCLDFNPKAKASKKRKKL